MVTVVIAVELAELKPTKQLSPAYRFHELLSQATPGTWKSGHSLNKGTKLEINKTPDPRVNIHAFL